MTHSRSGLWSAVIAGLLMASAAMAVGGGVELLRKGERVEVLIRGRPFTTYFVPADVAKPYLQPLRSARKGRS